jgi:hypothetical protein
VIDGVSEATRAAVEALVRLVRRRLRTGGAVFAEELHRLSEAVSAQPAGTVVDTVHGGVPFGRP